MKLPKIRYIVNDLKDVDQHVVLQKIQKNTLFSFSYIILLLSSTVICTLGLLLDSTPIVIGGMLISPLMWPLMKIAVGVSLELKTYIRQAINQLFLSIFLILLCSIIITYLSPIKLVNSEILSRTTPTLLDIFVAFAAGVIAAGAIMQKRISDSLAGVAIATSLLPPLCVSGVGIAVYDFQIASGAFILFMANVVSILFITIFVFMFAGIKRGNNPLRFRGIMLIAIILVITSFPLITFLTNYSFKAKTYSISQEVLETYLKTISSSISVENIKTSINRQNGEEYVFISADVLIPEGITLDYSQKNEIVSKLESELNRKIDLNLKVQRSIALKSKDEIVYGSIKERLIDSFRSEIEKVDNTIKISSLDVYSNSDNPYWTVDAVLLGVPGSLLTENKRSEIERMLQREVNQLVILNIEMIPRLKLNSQPDLENEKIKKDIDSYFNVFSKDIDVESIVLQGDSPDVGDESIFGNEYNVIISLRVPEDFEFSQESIDQLRDYLTIKYKKIFRLKVSTVIKQIYSI